MAAVSNIQTVKTILVVEDEKESLNAYREILTDMGYHVITAPDGGMGLIRALDAPEIDLVITDYRMPEMNGTDFIAALRVMLPAVPVIMLTAYADVEQSLDSLDLGVFTHASKPISKVEFERMVRAALAGAEQHTRARPNRLRG